MAPVPGHGDLFGQKAVKAFSVDAPAALQAERDSTAVLPAQKPRGQTAGGHEVVEVSSVLVFVLALTPPEAPRQLGSQSGQ